MAKKQPDEMTKGELLEEATCLGLDDQVTHKTKKGALLELVQKELRRRERAEAKKASQQAQEAPTAPAAPTLPAPAVTAVRKAPAVVPGTIQRVEPTLQHLVDGKRVPRERFLAICRGLYVTENSIGALERGAVQVGHSSLTVPHHHPGRMVKVHLTVRKAP